jgi:hypothetical protein
VVAVARASMAGLVCALMLAGSARAHADAPARLIYGAPAACPDAAAFAAAVHERAPRALLDEDAPRTFTIAIAASAAGFTGALTASDASEPRVLAAARCDDLVAALALITALAIDPSALADPPPAPPAPIAARWAADALVGIDLALGVAPDPLIAAALGARLRRRDLGHLDLTILAARDTTRTAAGTAQVTWLTARLSACWTAPARSIALDACGDAEAGLLSAAGHDVVRAQDLRRPWLALGGHGAIRWPATARIFGELDVGAAIPLIRDRFYFYPNVLIHQASVVTPWLAVGAGVRFW